MSSIGKDTLIYLPGRFVPAIMAFVTTAVLARHILSPEDFCRYDLTMRVVMFLSMTSIIWVTTVLLRFYPRFAPKEAGGAGGNLSVFDSVSTVLRWAGLSGGLFLLAVIRAAGPDSLFGSYRDLLGVAALVFIGNGLMELGLAMARARGKPWTYSIAATSNALLSLPIGMLVLWMFGTGVRGFMLGFALVTVVIATIFTRREVFRPVAFSLSREHKDFMKECLLYGLPILATLMVNFFLGNSDRFLLKYMLESDAAVGAYAAACRLLEQPVNMVFQTLMVAVFPAVTALYETKGREATEGLLRQLTRQFLLFCLPLCVMLAVLGHHIMFTLTSAEYRDAYLVAPWLVTAALVYGLSYYASFGLHLAKRSGTLLAITLASIVVNLAINRVTIGVYGSVGCGIARLAANVALTGLLALAARRHLHWSFPWISLARLGIASAVAGMAVYLLQQGLPPNLLTLATLGLVFGTVYALITLASGEVRVSEIRALLRMKGGAASR